MAEESDGQRGRAAVLPTSLAAGLERCAGRRLCPAPDQIGPAALQHARSAQTKRPHRVPRASVRCILQASEDSSEQRPEADGAGPPVCRGREPATGSARHPRQVVMRVATRCSGLSASERSGPYEKMWTDRPRRCHSGTAYPRSPLPRRARLDIPKAPRATGRRGRRAHHDS